MSAMVVAVFRSLACSLYFHKLCKGNDLDCERRALRVCECDCHNPLADSYGNLR